MHEDGERTRSGPTLALRKSAFRNSYVCLCFALSRWAFTKRRNLNLLQYLQNHDGRRQSDLRRLRTECKQPKRENPRRFRSSLATLTDLCLLKEGIKHR
jgi:hypothetical protein